MASAKDSKTSIALNAAGPTASAAAAKPMSSLSAAAMAMSSGSGGSSASDAPVETKHFTLEKECELRFEVDRDVKLSVTLRKGTAEMFGTELAADKTYHFTNTKGAVFSWHGAELEVKQQSTAPAVPGGSSASASGSSSSASASASSSDAGGSGSGSGSGGGGGVGSAGSGASVYVASDTPMVSYINAHAALENLRKQAESKKAMGPRVMIVGPGDSGKSTLTRLLLSYASRAGWKPTYVDLDVGQNGITIPGVLAASPVDHPIAIDGAPLYSSPPLAYFFGHTTPTAGIDLYNTLVDRLAAAVDVRAKQPDARHAGAVINTCGMVDARGQQLLVHAAAAFRVDVILVLDDERLENQLKSEPKLKHTAIAKLAKSGGVVKRESDFRRVTRDRAIAQYFYGHSNELKPHLKVLKFTDLRVYNAGQRAKTSSSMLPVGSKSLLDPNQLTPVPVTEQLRGKVLAVSYAKKPDELLKTNAAGFAFVQSVDTKTQTISLLTPSPSALPSNFLLSGNLNWTDT